MADLLCVPFTFGVPITKNSTFSSENKTDYINGSTGDFNFDYTIPEDGYYSVYINHNGSSSPANIYTRLFLTTTIGTNTGASLYSYNPYILGDPNANWCVLQSPWFYFEKNMVLHVQGMQAKGTLTIFRITHN